MKKDILNSQSFIVVVLVGLIVLNALAQQFPLQIDLTSGGLYTMSESSKTILKQLEDEVKVDVYVSEDLPVDATTVSQQIQDSLEEYKKYASNNLNITIHHPSNSEEDVKDLAEKGIPQLKFNIIEKDRLEVKTGFFGMTIMQGEDKEVIPIIDSVTDFEYNFISSVLAVSKKDKENIGILVGHQEKMIEVPQLEKHYNMYLVEITQIDKKTEFVKYVEQEEEAEIKEKEIVENLKTLIIAGPILEFAEEEIEFIDEFIQNKGSVIVLADAINPNPETLEAEEAKHGLNRLTSKYGITIDQNFVLDSSMENITYRQGWFTVSEPYPYWIKLLSDNFSDNPAFTKIQSLVLPWASSLSLSEKEEYNVTSLAKTTKKSRIQSDNFNLFPGQKIEFSENADGFTVAAISEPKDENSNTGTLVVIGDSDLILTNILSMAPDNLTFFLNLIDITSSSYDLVSIRSKQIVDRPIKELDEDQKTAWKFGTMFGSVVLLDLYGVIRITKRKKKRN
ncbi:MAG: GldG family protein [Patescibacteria group bacterium]